MILTKEDSLLLNAMVEHYELKPNKQSYTITNKGNGSIGLTVKNKCTVNLWETDEGMSFSYDGVPKAATQALLNYVTLHNLNCDTCGFRLDAPFGCACTADKFKF